DASDSAHGYTPGGTIRSMLTCLRRLERGAGGSGQRRERGTGRSVDVRCAVSLCPEAPMPMLRGRGRSRASLSSRASRISAPIDVPRSAAVIRSLSSRCSGRTIVVRRMAGNMLSNAGLCPDLGDAWGEDFDVFEAVFFEPAEDLVMRVPGLEARGIPIESIQHTPAPVALEADKGDAAQQPADDWQGPEIVERHGQIAQDVQRARWKACGKTAPEAGVGNIDLVARVVDRDGEFPRGF